MNPKDASTLSLKAVALARLGRLVEADVASAEALALTTTNYDVLYENALILTLLRKYDQAIVGLERAVQHGYSRERLKRDPDFAPLRSSAAFQRLLG